MNYLPSLLASLDPQAPLVQRHLWLVALFDWIRGDGRCASACNERVAIFLDAVQERPELVARLRAWWQVFLDNVDGTTLLADYGFAQRPAFVSEFFGRLGRHLLPATPQTHDAAELFSLLLPDAFDAQWLDQLEASIVQRLAELLGSRATGSVTPWHQMLIEAITYCVSQIRASGFAPELRMRMDAPSRDTQAFHSLVADFEAVRTALTHTPGDPAALERAVHHFKQQLDACRQAAASVYTHLDEHGISVDIVFRLRQLRTRAMRVRDLLDCLLSPTPAPSAAKLLSRLVLIGQESRSIRNLISRNSSLLAAKITDRSAETGEHYITRTKAEYMTMLRKAVGGGAVVSLTIFAKFALLWLGLSAFWNGFFAGVNYALSFVLIQMLHWVLATKQPAMTAPAMAAKLKDLGATGAVDAFVDEVTHLVRSQVAAVTGNLVMVVPCVLMISGALWLALGKPLIDPASAHHILDSLTLRGPTALFAALTGILLFASSLIAGWAENWFVLHRLDSALRYNPRITAFLGAERAARWARFMRDNISGLAASVSLGLMLGLVPAFSGFFGLGLEVRHVTLATGQLAAACATLGTEVFRMPIFWWCLASIPVIGALNVGASFYFAFRLALRAHNVSGIERSRIHAAIWKRTRVRPMSFLWPPRQAPAGGAPHG